ncbi:MULTISPECIES: DUF1684 domain-containing protein [unclassified Polaribacter]|uniref:DUF1684 domain-containing protein n=1 Tax=unclassified Polaribacter TaxID=196858 RepID=UPI0011BEC61E|nr:MULTISPECIES: DUF1684 domain-containing protein [unclassified Polaribacter]TXD53934.1 DUF1684 domain-containing protein [Polaribacter sp. IC063]TXD58518.1 DUF1684 domain-containing protein [Polaribacter sp. IC066]
MKFLTILSFLFLLSSCNSQYKRALVGDTEYQRHLNASFKDASKSPLKKKDLKNFKGLDFFPVDSTFIAIAKLIKTENAITFSMATNTERKALYKEYGVLKFSLKEKDFELTIYQSQEELEDEKYKDDLYLAFTDNTSGKESYGAGRYLDIKTTDEQPNGTILLNFNNTFNPYCAYNELFSCPLTPRKNHLDTKITAGIKDFLKE